MSQVVCSTVKAPQIHKNEHQKSFFWWPSNPGVLKRDFEDDRNSFDDTCHGMSFWGVRRCRVIHASIGKGHDLVLDALPHGEPVELSENRGDVVPLSYP